MKTDAEFVHEDEINLLTMLSRIRLIMLLYHVEKIWFFNNKKICRGKKCMII